MGILKMKNADKLQDLQSAPLRYKVILTEERIREAVRKYGLENCYISFSGGKDSLVLLLIVRRLYPTMKAIFFDTGLEDPRIRRFVKTIENVVWITPKTTYKEVVEKYGVPILSKSISMAISRYRNAWRAVNKAVLKGDWAIYLSKFKQMSLRLHGGINPTSGKKQTTGVIPKKWHGLAKNHTFNISDECCNFLKKKPAKAYYIDHGGCALIGTMASDSHNRKLDYYKHGCNAFDKKMPQSRPLMLWNEADIWQYIKENNVAYCDIYNEKGCDRTGCDICLMGIEKDRERFVRLKKSRPYRWKYCMEKLGYRDILKALNIPTGEEGGDEVGREEETDAPEAEASTKAQTPKAETQTEVAPEFDFAGERLARLVTPLNAGSQIPFNFNLSARSPPYNFVNI